MCVIYLAFESHPAHPFILLANRDEFYRRPSAASHFWDDAPNIYAGRDLEGGGTWLGVTTEGRFAAVTNYRDPSAPTGTRSRGELVANFLLGTATAQEYLATVNHYAAEYSGFNLIVGEMNSTRRGLMYLSNRSDGPLHMKPGVYGLSNHLLDTPWPKVARGKESFQRVLDNRVFDSERCFEILAERSTATDEDLPATGVPYEVEKAISSIFIEIPGYGTRCSTVLTFDNELKWNLDERTWV